MRKQRVLLISILCFIMAILFAYFALKEISPYIEAESTYKRIKLDNIETADNDQEQEDPLNRIIDWTSLQSMNQDVCGWIYIPGTHVDYPICQGQDKKYYLNHNAERKYNILGAIFMSPENAMDFSDMHTIIYGHNMRSGKMFGDLSEYGSEEFRNTHPNIYIYTVEKSCQYEVFNSFSCLSGSSVYMTGFRKESSEYRTWIQEMVKHGFYSTIYRPAPTEQIVTLSTCSDTGNKESRFAVQGVLREERGRPK